jgi:hypothetical protein
MRACVSKSFVVVFLNHESPHRRTAQAKRIHMNDAGRASTVREVIRRELGSGVAPTNVSTAGKRAIILLSTMGTLDGVHMSPPQLANRRTGKSRCDPIERAATRGRENAFGAAPQFHGRDCCCRDHRWVRNSDTDVTFDELGQHRPYRSTRSSAGKASAATRRRSNGHGAIRAGSGRPDASYSNPRSRSSRRIGSGMAATPVASARPKSAGAAASVR